MVRKVTKLKIISLYLKDYSKRYYLRELADLLKKPHQTIKPYVEELTKDNILKKIIRKNITEYSLNFKNKNLYDYLTMSEKEDLNERLKQDILIKTLFEKLSKFFNNNTFIIFGSTAKKTGANIDLLTIGKQDTSKEIKDFEKIYNKRIHNIQTNSLKNLTLTLTKEIYKKHLILNNTEQVIRFFGGLYEQNKLVLQN